MEEEEQVINNINDHSIDITEFELEEKEEKKLKRLKKKKKNEIKKENEIIKKLNIL